MAIAFRAVASVTASAHPATLAVPLPAGTTNGDMLVMFTSAQQLSGALPVTPAGWSVLNIAATAGGSAVGVATGVWWRIASSEPASYTVNPGGDTANSAAGAIVGYTGGSTSIRDHKNVVTSVSSTTSPTPGTLTGLASQDMAIINYSDSDPGGSMTLPGGSWNTRLQLNVGGGHVLSVIDQLGGTATPTASSPSADHWSVNSVGLAAPGSGNFLAFFS